MSVTRRSFFVESHKPEIATQRSPRPSVMCCFFVRVFLTSQQSRDKPLGGTLGAAGTERVRLSLTQAGFIPSKVRSCPLTVAQQDREHLEV
jgi:hypothetical protein